MCVLSVAYSLHIVVNTCTSTKLIHSVKCMSIYSTRWPQPCHTLMQNYSFYVHFNFGHLELSFEVEIYRLLIFSLIVVKRMNKKVLTTQD